MKPALLAVEPYRVAHPLGGMGDATNGVALIPGPRRHLRVIFSGGDNWDHVSVSTPGQPPTWEEMCFIKDLFFESEECVVQFHPPRSVYKNQHRSCLHMWRWQGGSFPMPDLGLVTAAPAPPERTSE